MHGEHTLEYEREYKMDIPGDIPKEHVTKEAHGESMGNTRIDIVLVYTHSVILVF